MRYRTFYGLGGVILGVGAPLGAILGRGVLADPAWWLGWFSSEWADHSYFYIYMGIGCAIAFSAFGYFMGKRADQLRLESDSLSGTFMTLNLLAIKDGLTGLYNHRYLQERLGLEMEVADRRQTPLTCLMIDIDDFKAVNDRCGHPFGDAVLAGTARIIRESIRSIDTAGRYGGEEFLILMPQTHPEVAEGIAERIRKAVETHVFQAHDRQARITLSIGIATYPNAGLEQGDKGAFLEAVDSALYRAKTGGKNRIFYYGQKNSRHILQKESA